jgi:hypothetical protein
MLVLTAGTYTVTATDGVCSATGNIHLINQLHFLQLFQKQMQIAA